MLITCEFQRIYYHSISSIRVVEFAPKHEHSNEIELNLVLLPMGSEASRFTFTTSQRGTNFNGKTDLQPNSLVCVFEDKPVKLIAFRSKKTHSIGSRLSSFSFI